VLADFQEIWYEVPVTRNHPNTFLLNLKVSQEKEHGKIMRIYKLSNLQCNLIYGSEIVL